MGERLAVIAVRHEIANGWKISGVAEVHGAAVGDPLEAGSSGFDRDGFPDIHWT
ncbi:Hypothetical protein A7982_00991 [Minicystis rosea]|nr:Hypothetical protein A7982_00991 [Minicystis rosea]